jgi:hypothetical protein
MTRPADLDRAIVLFKAAFGPGVVVLCGSCHEHPAEPADRWCSDCNALYREHVGPLPLSIEARPGPPPGTCGWCGERPAIDGSRLCSECDAGTDTASIGVPITDREVRAAGFVPTARGWVPRTPELRERLEAAVRARSAEREAEDERQAALRRVIRQLKGRPA